MYKLIKTYMKKFPHHIWEGVEIHLNSEMIQVYVNNKVVKIHLWQ